MAELTLETAAFPTLSDAQIAQLAECTGAARKTYRDGDVLVGIGESDFACYVVLSGGIEIIDRSGDQPRTVTVHRRGQFTGDTSHLSGTRSVVSAVARGDTEVIEIPRSSLREMLNECPVLSDLILQAFIARRQLLRESPDFTGYRVIGSRYSQDTFRIRDFMARNRALFTWVDLETEPQVDQLLQQFGVTAADTPVLACGRKLIVRNPSNRELADLLGIHRPLDGTLCDLAVVGAGPAGLAASVYGASEGLETVVLEHTAAGGQAGTSMRIENYLGFPLGITGSDLTSRAALQARKFGARFSLSGVTRVAFENNYPILHLDDGETLTTRCLLIATGVEYRRLAVEGCEQFEGRGIYYAATPAEAQLCKGADALVVGGGNSAGQAAVFLAAHARRVLLLIRGDDLNKSMSRYLAHRIEQARNIELLRSAAIQRMCGNSHLEAVEIVQGEAGQRQMVETPAVFSFIGAMPRTDWLPPKIERDDKGFVRTGPELGESGHWTARRQPFILETSCPGVFAAGDVRAGSVKRVAAAVGEGAMAVQLVHEYLKET
jgi:thioredoxin reductase (NADPH)